MQYYKPDGNLNVGDCMPFYLDGVFRLYYLVDEGHHRALGGLGGHQWAQASSRDLTSWEHHPLAIPITEAREGSICTGSVLHHEGTFFGFYATRMRDRTQHLSLATSSDGIRFVKQTPNPFASPPHGYDPLDYRDPCVFHSRADGRFHMLVTASLTDPPVPGRGGCLAHLVSEDLRHWEQCEPFIIPGLPGAPECPDYFAWRGWHYLIFSNEGVARYRLSRDPFGPWLRPPVDTFDGPAARVMKTAAFTGDRRIGVAWIGAREGNTDHGAFQFGGNAVFRELVQAADGTLRAKFPAEMVPWGRALSNPAIKALASGVGCSGRGVRLSAPEGLAAAVIDGVPRDVRLTLRVAPAAGVAGFGLRLRAAETFNSGYELHFAPHAGVVRLNEQVICGVTGLDHPFDLEVVLMGDLIDVCIDGRRTVIDRCPERVGEWAFLYAQDGEVVFDVAEVVALT
jgi:beta-fructofuranosidase